MRYTKFIIENFKGIKELTLDLDKEPKSKVFTLVGLNESGKTSILEALNLFSIDVPEKLRHTLIPKSEKISFSGTISIKAFVEVNGNDNLKIKDFASSLGIKEIEEVSKIEITKKYIYKNSEYLETKKTWNYLPIIKKKGKGKPRQLDGEEWKDMINYLQFNLLPNIVYYPNFLFEFPEKIYIDDYVGNAVEAKTYKAIVQDVLSSIREDLTIKDQLLIRMESFNKSNSEALDSTLAYMSSKVSKVIFQAWEKLFSKGNKAIEINWGSEEQTITKKTTAGTTNEEVTRYYLNFQLKEGANKFHINERSLGFKWFFAFLLFTEFRKNRNSDGREILFLLDEPASNLHSTAQKKLLKTFESLLDKSTLIYTTHSHHLINPEWLNGTYVIRNKSYDYKDDFEYVANKTDIEAVQYRKFIQENPEQKDYFQPILDTLDYQPGLLEKIPNLIITEGKNDFYTLKYIDEVYFNGKYRDLNIYPATGADTNDQVIKLYLAWNRKFIILLDGDEKGEKAKSRYIKNHGLLVLDRIYNLAEIDSSFNGKELEELFSDEEKVEITKLFDNKSKSYEKGKFNSSIQTLLLEKKPLGLNKATLEGFEKIFKFLKVKI